MFSDPAATLSAPFCRDHLHACYECHLFCYTVRATPLFKFFT